MASATFSYSDSCAANGSGQIIIDALGVPPGSGVVDSYGITIISSTTGTDYGGPATVGQTFDSLANDRYTLRVTAYYADGSTGTSIPATLIVDCAVSGGGGGCSLVVTILGYTVPTTPGGWGEIRYHVSGTVDNQQSAAIFTSPGGLFVNGMTPYGDGDYSAPVPAVGIGTLCRLVVNEAGGVAYDLIESGCFAVAEFTIPAPPAPPTEPDATEWFAVGGLLPNPARLRCKITSLTKLGAGGGAPVPRAGLHIEAELFRVGVPLRFARVRKTVRVLDELLDVTKYLRSQVSALYRYQPASIAYDGDPLLAFTYRYREVDADSIGPWVARPAVRYAVLAALPLSTDLVTQHLADPVTPGDPHSAFAELTHFVGYKLELTILIPRDRPDDLFLEHRYFDGAGREVGIACWTVYAGTEGGLIRFPHIDYCPPCAVRVESALVDTDRGYNDTCGPTATLPPVGTGNLTTGPGYLLLNPKP